MGNAVVHAEIGAADDQPLVAFYGALFGWTVTGGGPGGAGLADTGAGRGIQGPFRDPAGNVAGVR